MDCCRKTHKYDERHLFWCFMSRTEKYPLFGRRHLRTRLRVALNLNKYTTDVKQGFVEMKGFNLKLSIAYKQAFGIGLHFVFSADNEQKPQTCNLTAMPFNSMQNCRRCSYFQTPSSCESGAVKISSIFVKSRRIACWIYYIYETEGKTMTQRNNKL